MKPLDLEKLQRDREGVTRDGRRIIIYTVKAPGLYCIHGRVDDGASCPLEWMSGGNFLANPNHESGKDLLNKPEVEEEKKTQDLHCGHCWFTGHEMKDCPDYIEYAARKYGWKVDTLREKLSTLPPTKPSESCETFDWIQAMKLRSEGIESQQYYEQIGWRDVMDEDRAEFYKGCKYRRKPVPEPEQTRKAWVDVYEDEKEIWFKVKKQADTFSDPNRIACVEVEIKFKKGQGL